MRLRLAALVLFSGCVEPTAGTWAFTDTSEESSCPGSFLPDEDPAGDGTIEVDTDVPEIVFTDANLTMIEAHCPLTGLDFTCDFAESDETRDFADEQLAGSYTTDERMVGSFDSATEAHGLTSLTSSCVGADCAELSDRGYPDCHVSWYWAATLAE